MTSLLKSLARNWAPALFSPLPFVQLRHLPRYLLDRRRFKAMPGATLLRWGDARPCLGDAVKKTPFDPHYFHQGAWLARCLADIRPNRHVDVGSSILTMGVLSGHVPTVFVDIRPPEIDLPNLVRVSGDITRLPFADNTVQSLSCLHVIEHIGLGRYGDPLDPAGSERAAKELCRILAVGGSLFLSTPVGHERICFNAHRVFSPETIRRFLEPLELTRFAFVNDAGVLTKTAMPEDAYDLDYGCGLFEFRKRN